MTIALGIITKGAIVLACDSQTTKDGTKRTDAQKLTSLAFGKSRVLVAQAGNAGISARAIEILKEAARDVEITDYRTAADLAQASMVKVKQEVQRQHLSCSMEELREIIWKTDLQAELLLAHYFKGKPYLFKIDFAVGRADKENCHFACLGSGANLGQFLLFEHARSDMNPGPASVLAGYIIGTVCKHDSYCSLPAKVGVLVDDVTAVGGSPNPHRIHPSAVGASMIVIEEVDSSSPAYSLLRKLIEAEKQRRYERIERLLEVKRVAGVKLFDELVQEPSIKQLRKLKKQFRNIILVETFNTRK